MLEIIILYRTVSFLNCLGRLAATKSRLKIVSLFLDRRLCATAFVCRHAVRCENAVVTKQRFSSRIVRKSDCGILSRSTFRVANKISYRVDRLKTKTSGVRFLCPTAGTRRTCVHTRVRIARHNRISRPPVFTSDAHVINVFIGIDVPAV